MHNIKLKQEECEASNNLNSKTINITNMEKVLNVEVYNNSEEIIEILSKLPPLEECDNMNLLQFIRERTEHSGYGIVIFIDSIVYSVYKFYKHLYRADEVSLLMTKSHEKYTLEQHKIWSAYKEQGLSLSNEIYGVITNHLIGIYASYNICRRFQ
jgi:hypothetical protein